MKFLLNAVFSQNMKVKLVSLTNAIIEGKQLTPEELIVYTARVSNPSNQMNFETSDKLVSYLVKNKHWSPFEMVDMTVEITTSRGIAQQILRHRSFSFQEFSQRYSKVNTIEPVNLRYKGETNRQSSSDSLSDEDSEYFTQKMNETACRFYKQCGFTEEHIVNIYHYRN